MKKLLFTLMALLTITTITKAQEVKYGIKAGVNVAQWGGDAKSTIKDVVDLAGVLSTEANVGFHVGPSMSIAVNDQLTFETALLFSKKGYKIRGKLTEEDGQLLNLLNLNVRVTQNAYYIDLPVVAKYKVTEGLSIFGGAQFSYLISNELDLKAGILGFNVLNKQLDIMQNFRKMDVGLSAGVGYDFKNGMNISASYDWGLTSLDKNSNFDAFNRVAKVSIGYTF